MTYGVEIRSAFWQSSERKKRCVGRMGWDGNMRERKMGEHTEQMNHPREYAREEDGRTHGTNESSSGR